MDASTVAIEGTIAAATAHARMRRGRRRLAEDGGGDLPDGRGRGCARKKRSEGVHGRGGGAALDEIPTGSDARGTSRVAGRRSRARAMGECGPSAVSERTRECRLGLNFTVIRARARVPAPARDDEPVDNNNSRVELYGAQAGFSNGGTSERSGGIRVLVRW